MLSEKQVGDYMNKEYVCVFQQLADYTEGQGNTAGYFLNSDRKVLSVIAGKMRNVNVFLNTAKQAKHLNRTNSPELYKYFFSTSKTNVAALLAASPYPRVENIYWIVFTEILEERMDYEMSSFSRKD